MPKDDTTNQQSNNYMPPIVTEDTLPPMPPLNKDDQILANQVVTPVPSNNSSVAPSDDITMSTVVTSGPNTKQVNKKFAGGKVIATILGIFLLIGGIGAGTILTQQNQNIEEEAARRGSINDCESYGSPKKRQACRDVDRANKGETLNNGVTCTNDNGCIGGSLTGNTSRCEILSLCQGTSCAREFNSECGGEQRTTTVTDTASCQSAKAYSSTWAELTPTQLTALRAGNIVNFCVSGTTTGGTFTKAMFTINDVVQSETTMQRPGSTDFCQQYTIPTGVTTFNVIADIFHSVLGWR